MPPALAHATLSEDPPYLQLRSCMGSHGSTDDKVGEDGKLHVIIRKFASSMSVAFSWRSQCPHSGLFLTPRPSNLTNAEIHSLHSSRNPTSRQSSFGNATDDKEREKAVPGRVFSPVFGMKKNAGVADNVKELHMFVWSHSASTVSDGRIHVFRGGGGGNIEPHFEEACNGNGYEEYGRSSASRTRQRRLCRRQARTLQRSSIRSCRREGDGANRDVAS